MIYLFVVFLLLGLIYYYDYKDFHNNRDFWYKVVLAIFILLAGLRYRLGIDTPRYIYDYFHETPFIYDLTLDELDIGNYPLWNILNSLLYTIGVKFYVVQLIESAFVNILIFKYIQKHSSCIFTCVFFFFIWMYPSYCMEAMKAGFSMVLTMYAHDYMLERKWVKGGSLFLVAFLFHMSVIIIAAFSIFTFLKLDFKGGIILLFAFISGRFLLSAYGDLIEIFSFNEQIMTKAENYGDSDEFFALEGMNVYYYIVHFLTILMPSVFAFYVVKTNKNLDLLKLEPYLFLGLFFITISANIIIFFRIYYFYIIYIILFISQALIDLLKGNRNSLIPQIKLCAIIIPFLVFIFISYYGVRWMRYYPYSSVVEKSIDKGREQMYNSIRDDFCQAREYEY